MHFVIDNALEATRALDAAGFDYIIREVVVVKVLDEPGTLGEVALVMAEAGVNIDSVYAPPAATWSSVSTTSRGRSRSAAVWR